MSWFKPKIYNIYIYIYILFYKIILYLKANEWYFPFWFLGGGRGIGRECLVFDCVKDYFVNVDNFLAYKNWILQIWEEIET